jgi:hypothetical protein
MHGSISCACPFCRYASGDAAADTSDWRVLTLGATDRVPHAQTPASSDVVPLAARPVRAERANAERSAVAIGESSAELR